MIFTEFQHTTAHAHATVGLCSNIGLDLDSKDSAGIRPGWRTTSEIGAGDPALSFYRICPAGRRFADETTVNLLRQTFSSNNTCLFDLSAAGSGHVLHRNLTGTIPPEPLSAAVDAGVSV